MASASTDNKGILIALKRWFYINYHRLTTLPVAWKGWTLRLVGYALIIAPTALFLWAKRADLSLLYIALQIAGLLVTAYTKLRPDFDSLTISTRINIEVAKIMRQTYQTFDGAARKEYQQRLLVAIASYVRSLRNDASGTKIYANLLVRDRREGKKVIVVARSHHEAGENRAEHDLDKLAVRQCFLLGDSVEVGDIWVEFPHTDRTKRYRSILGIPLKSVESDSPEVIGVLSIDSSAPYHFAKWEAQIRNLLLPLTTILELTLERPR